MAATLQVGLCERECFARGDAELQLDEVESPDHLGHGMFDLQPRVHLHEERLVRAIARDDELDGSGVDVTACPRRGDRLSSDCISLLLGQEGRGRLFDDLLVTPLQAALSLAEVHDVVVSVGEHLDLDVPRTLDEPFDQQRAVAECTERLAFGGCDRGGKIFGREDEAHAFATSACRRLDQGREPDAACLRRQLLIVQPDSGHSRDHLDAPRRNGLFRSDLVAHRFDDGGRRADEDDPGVSAGRGERAVLGEESIAGVQCLRTGGESRLDDPLDREVARACRCRADAPCNIGVRDVPRVGVGVAVHGDRADPHRPQRADDADRDLSPIGDEHRVEHGGLAHIRNTP